MIVAIGFDLVDVDRIADAMERTGGRFATRILAPAEAESGRPPPPHELAVRFAAKEAVMKALGTGMARGVVFPQVEVTDPLGAPAIVLNGTAAERASDMGLTAIHATTSLANGVATALVILEGGRQ